MGGFIIQTAGPHRQQHPHPKGFNVCQALIGHPSLGVLTIGIGWDVDHPPRPWPWATVRTLPRAGAKYACMSFCCAFVGVAWGAR